MGPAGLLAAGGLAAWAVSQDITPRTEETQREQSGRFGRRGAAGGFYQSAPDDPDAPAPRPGEVTAAQRTAYQFFVSRGHSPAQAAGIVGHLTGESGLNLNTGAFNPAGGGQGAHGIGQWRGERINRFRQMYGREIRDSTLEQQLEYVDWELRNSERASGNALRQTGSAGDAARTVMERYGRPGPEDRSGPRRSSQANRIFEELGRAAVPAVPQVPRPTSSSAPISFLNVAIADNTSDRFNVKASYSGSVFDTQPTITQGLVSGFG